MPWDRFRRPKTGKADGRGLFSGRAGGAPAQALALVQRGQELERALEVRNAVKVYEELNALVPNNSQYLSMLSKTWSDTCYLDELKEKKEQLSSDQKREANIRAAELARQAMEADPRDSLPHVACCISLGRLAIFSDNKTKVKLASEARQEAVTALEKDPTSDLAHHLMGRWHWEMAQLNVVVRALVRMMYGTALSPGTHAEALASYQRAVELNPNRLVHHVELGRCHAKLGNKEEARRELELALLLDVEDINSRLQKDDAELILKDLRRSMRGWTLPNMDAAMEALMAAKQPGQPMAGGAAGTA
ncbi:hypothetical protein WJX72_011282 [[Myrmecia] bisecta]|uniref:Regulator of microtubule dynamics protein 1 n=1 Tax=[Myrmecia] bisecta TaxID=41462 RepID=A0AAW1PZG3_9CHLO